MWINYETRCAKIKLRPNSLEKVREWAKVINKRKAEALETLRDESVFLDQNSEGDFLIYVMKAVNFEKSKEVFEKSAHAIGNNHQNFKDEYWEDSKKLEMLIDLDRIGEIK